MKDAVQINRLDGREWVPVLRQFPFSGAVLHESLLERV
jgi:hypothetical protein